MKSAALCSNESLAKNHTITATAQVLSGAAPKGYGSPRARAATKQDFSAQR